MNANQIYIPEIGDKLFVKVVESAEKIDFYSQVLDIIDDNMFIIRGPIKKNVITPLNLGLLIDVKYYKKNKGRFSFIAQIDKRSYEDIYKLTVYRKSEIIKIQERNFFRLPIMINIRKVNKNEVKLERAEIEECITEDISGGGLKILCNTVHNVNDIIICTININKNIKFTAEVVRVENNIDNLEYNYAIGVKFLDIIENDREKIIKYIFDKQRTYRKKGLM